MNTERILGIILLVAGLGVIGYTLFLSFDFFTGQAEPPEVFVIERPVVQEQTSPKSIEEAIPQLLESQLQNILPLDSLPRMLNLAVWSVFAGILIFAGTQIASLGIKLMKQ